MHILLVSIFLKRHMKIFLNVFFKFAEWLKIVKECSQTILIFIITHGQRTLLREVGEMSEYVQIVSSFFVLGYLIGYYILVTLQNTRESVEFDSCFIAPKFCSTTLSPVGHMVTWSFFIYHDPVFTESPITNSKTKLHFIRPQHLQEV